MNNIYVSVCMVIVSTLSGCAINGTNISQNGTVTIERIDSETLFMPWADAYEEGNNLMIRGVIEQRYQSSNSLKAHVDVTIIDSNGQLLKETKTANVYVPRNLPGKGIKWVRFNLTVPMMVSKGTTIKLHPGAT